MDAGPSRADVVGAGEVVVGAWLALADERGHAPERVGGGTARLARATRAITLVTAAVQGIVEAGARVAVIQRAGHVVVAVERLPAASAGMAAVVHGTGVGFGCTRCRRGGRGWGTLLWRS